MVENDPAIPQPAIPQPPIAEPPIAEPPIAEPPIAEPPIAEPPIAEPPVAEPPIAEDQPALPAMTPSLGQNKAGRSLHARLQEALGGGRSGTLTRWVAPAVLLLTAALVGFSLLGKLREKVWTYYTDDQGTQAEVNDEKTRYVLWQDPESHLFEEPARPQKNSKDPAPPSPNLPGGKLEAAFSPDGTRMVLVRWQAPDSNADMYLSSWNGRTWSRPAPLKSLNTESNERGPAFSRDGRHLYFSSDREGGTGGYDLYVAMNDGKDWKVQSLGEGLNSQDDESGPAVSSDDNRLYFSSNRSGTREEDIFIAERMALEPEKQKFPKFSEAQAVKHLNSKEHDVQAALTRRGEHVFLASDRDSRGSRGYGVYFSRVVDGKSLKPEKVDLYIKDGNVTDPAVRMDGFDLVFSADHEADSTGEGTDYRLYRSTTREVIGYTNLARWEQFKDLLRTIGWWIFLALAALIALIYLLESWRDITSLFHKCLAGSAAAHLFLLILFALLVIAKEIEQQSDPPPDVLVSIDALSEEELALESVPEETEITQPDLAHEAEKAAANFDIPEFKPQEDAQAVPLDAEFQQQAMEVEVKAAAANHTEEVAEPTEPSALLSELSETALPEPDQPVLEELEFAEAPEAPNPAETEFAPAEPVPAAERSNTQTVADTAVTTPTDAAEIQPSETITDSPAPTPLAEVAPAQAEQADSDQTDAPEALESELLAALPETSPLQAEPVELEENDPSENNNPANPTQDTFDPTNTLPVTTSKDAHANAPSDTPAENQAEASEVSSGSIETTTVADGPASPTGEADSESEAPESVSDSAPSRDLPESALVDTGIPQLEEGNPAASNEPANPANEAFNPSDALTANPSAPAEGEPISDAAVPDQAEVAEIGGGELAQNPVPEAASPVGEARAEQSLPEARMESDLSTNLPVTTLLDPGAPQLDEGEPNPDNEPANPANEAFTPDGATASTTTTPVDGGPIADAAVPDQADAAEVTGGAVARAEPTSGPSSTVGEAQAEESVAQPQLESGLSSNLPETDLLDSGAPRLDEGENEPAGAPGDESFKPESSSALASRQGSETTSDTAESSQADATEIGKGELTASEAEQGSAEAVGEAQAEEGATGEPSALAGNLPDSSPLDPGAPALEEGPRKAAGGGDESFKPDRGTVTAKQGAETGGDAAESSQADSSEVGQGELAAREANEGSAQAVGEAQSAEGLSGEPSTLSSNLPDASPLDPGAPALDEGPRAATEGSGDEPFKPGSGAMASNKATDAGADSGSATSSQIDTESISGDGLATEGTNLTNPQDGLEAGSSETVTTPGAVGPISLEPTLTGSLLPGKLDAPANLGTSDFIKKQRGRPSMDTIKQLGGSDGTEKAIRASLRWLAENQEEDGRWDSKKHGAKGKFDTGNAGLALLCFFGWGARHDRDGEYRDHVQLALDYLLSIQEDNGDLSGEGLMYCHAIASIALCEAYGISKDERLRDPAERSIAYTLAAQSKSRGGWRYNPGEDSDTSITGWQYMALHSARLAGLKIPEENFERARRWLDQAGGGKHGGLYGYQGPGTKWPAMIATGMFCRQLDLVPPTAPRQIESARQLKMRPMKTSRPDYYYIYYATLALYQHQGSIWKDWNQRLKDTLPRVQNKTGSKEGSWDPSRGLAGNGGRITSTALATLSLEVYYRILPIYGFRGNADDTPELKIKKDEGEPEDE